MTYRTLSAPVFASFVIKKSEFLAYAYPIVHKSELVERVTALRKKYPDARHVCYGYIIGDPNNTTSAGFDDDGEPNGTAGRPILNVLQHKAIGNCVVIVVRYFGGIKLGAGGLTRAYSQATQLAVDQMQLTEFVPLSSYRVSTDFANEAHVRHYIHLHEGQIVHVEYGEKVVLTITIANQQQIGLSQDIGLYAKLQKLD